MTVTSPYLRDLQPSNLFVLLAGITVIGIMMIRKKNSALICGIVTSALLAYALGIQELPIAFVTAPPAFPDILNQDLFGAMTPTIFPVIVILFFLTFFDSIASILGLSSLIHQVGEPETIPDIRRSFLVNGISMMISPLVGCTTSAIFIESVAGVEEGGRTGLVAVVAALFIVASLFCLPLPDCIPSCCNICSPSGDWSAYAGTVQDPVSFQPWRDAYGICSYGHYEHHSEYRPWFEYGNYHVSGIHVCCREKDRDSPGFLGPCCLCCAFPDYLSILNVNSLVSFFPSNVNFPVFVSSGFF